MGAEHGKGDIGMRWLQFCVFYVLRNIGFIKVECQLFGRFELYSLILANYNYFPN